MNVPNLTTITGQGGRQIWLHLQSTSGGRIDLPVLSSVNGSTFLTASGENSIIDAPMLSTFTGIREPETGNGFNVSNNAAINVPSLTSVSRADITIGTSGTMSTSQLATFFDTNLGVRQNGLDFSSLVNIDGSGLYVQEPNVTLTLPGVTSYHNTRIIRGWQATAVNSVLSLPNLTAITGQGGRQVWLHLQSTSGGRIDLPVLTSVNGSTFLTASGNNSIIDAPMLSTFTGIREPETGNGFNVSNNAAINLGSDSPRFTMSVADIQFSSGGRLVTGDLITTSDVTVLGTGTIDGSFTNGSAIRPGTSPGGITVTGDFEQTASGRLFIEVAGTQPVTGYDVLQVGGTAKLGGELSLSVSGGFVPTLGQQFEVVSAGEIEGTFQQIVGASVGNGIKLNTVYQTDAVVLEAGLDVPTADILDVTPDPRNSSVGVVTVQFDRAVTGVDISDFRLTRDGNVIDLSGLSVVRVSAQQYTINLSSVTTADGTYVLTLRALGSGIVDSSSIAFVTDAADTFTIDTVPPQVSQVTIDNGTGQRSVIRSITVTFDSLVVADPGAFVVTTKSGTPVQVTAALSTIANKTQAILTFGGSLTDASRSLIDGNYRLQILSTHVRDIAGNGLDGNPLAIGSDHYVDEFFRLFGDVDGDRDVDALDYQKFQSSYRSRQGSTNFISAFDHDGDGDVDAADLLVFRRQFGKRLNP